MVPHVRSSNFHTAVGISLPPLHWNLMTFSNATLFSFAAFLALSVGACTLQTSNAGTDGGANSSTGATLEPGTPAPLTCPRVLDCIGACAETDADCPKACLAQGNADAQTKTVALAECSVGNKCQDGACLTSKCSAELNACMEQAASQDTGTATTEPAPVTGSVPPALVGTWSTLVNVSIDGGAQYEFAADGKTTALFVYELNYNCTSKISAASEGNTVVSGDTLTFFRTGGTQTSSLCGGGTKVGPIAASTNVYTYKIGIADGRTALSLTSDGSTTIYYRKE